MDWKLDDVLPPGKHRLEVTFEGSVTVEPGERMTVVEAIDSAYPGAWLKDWVVKKERNRKRKRRQS